MQSTSAEESSLRERLGELLFLCRNSLEADRALVSFARLSYVHFLRENWEEVQWTTEDSLERLVARLHDFNSPANAFFEMIAPRVFPSLRIHRYRILSKNLEKDPEVIMNEDPAFDSVPKVDLRLLYSAEDGYSLLYGDELQDASYLLFEKTKTAFFNSIILLRRRARGKKISLELSLIHI